MANCTAEWVDSGGISGHGLRSVRSGSTHNPLCETAEVLNGLSAGERLDLPLVFLPQRVRFLLVSGLQGAAFGRCSRPLHLRLEFLRRCRECLGLLLRECLHLLHAGLCIQRFGGWRWR